MIPKATGLSLDNSQHDPPTNKNVATPQATLLPCVRSEDLFGKDREIMIEHTGVYYRLCVTRANKLILMK